MTPAQTDVQNKESRENKFLSEKIIQKAIASGGITNESVPEITELFQGVFLEHKGESARVRAEAIMLVLRDYVANNGKEKKSEDVELTKQTEIPAKVPETDKSVIDEPIAKEEGEDEEEKEERERQEIYEREKKLLQKIIDEKISNSDLLEKFHEKANQFIFDETSHIIGTSVNEHILTLSVTRAFEEFENKEEVQEETTKELEEAKVKTEAPVDKVEEEKEENNETIKNEDKDTSSEESDLIEDSTQPVPSEEKNEEKVVKDEEAKNKPTKKKKLSFKEAILEKARQDDINNPLKPNTLHWPTTMVSIGEPIVQLTHEKALKEEIVVKSTPDQIKDNIPNKKKEAEKQEKSSEYMNFIKPINSIGSPVEPVKMMENPETMEFVEPRKKQSKQKSNQSEVNFDRFINDQIGSIMEVVRQNNIFEDKKFNEIQKGLEERALDISKDTKVSMTERAQRLDKFFREQKNLYVVKKIEKVSDSKSMIDEIIKLSEREVNTGNHEADERFRKTLKNALSSKAECFTDSKEDVDLIKEALDEEYEKHKSFYIKNK